MHNDRNLSTTVFIIDREETFLLVPISEAKGKNKKKNGTRAKFFGRLFFSREEV